MSGNTAIAQGWVFKERKDSRRLNLTVEGPDGGFVVPVQLSFRGEARVDSGALETRARALAMEVNRRSSAMAPTDTADSQPSNPDIPDQIRKLAELRDSGILSSEEFEAKKAELLSKM
jgi:hypothetical protein